MSLQNQSYNFNSMDIIRFVFKHKWPIFGVTIIAAIASVIVSYMITPKFRSSVILFPKTQVSASQALNTSELINTDDHIMNFGDEEATEQLIQTLYSEEIRFKIIDKFNLLQHYQIDEKGGYPMTKLHETFMKNIRFKRTEYMAIQIEVLDADPKMAADIANEIAVLLDSTLNEMQRDVAVEIFKMVDNQYQNLQTEIVQIEESIKKINKTEPKYISLTEQLINENKRLSSMKSKLVEAEVNALQKLPRKFIVANAYAAEKKSYPVRWVICAVSTLSAFVFAVLLMLFLERYKDLFKFK
ncbi:MAG: hypothetical protein A2W99_17175 [Bacteroidetes bacterium GWF2_33_16]|nr:MAG: hypothetical protein A2X00_13620 [Bacteroidetes bacterium GWE2_32_14]OFY03479.1 MAG: hypothetical protein A2W99_17175 [Bacteroidetes bacterium GWF2_33_16]